MPTVYTNIGRCVTSGVVRLVMTSWTSASTAPAYETIPVPRKKKRKKVKKKPVSMYCRVVEP